MNFMTAKLSIVLWKLLKIRVMVILLCVHGFGGGKSLWWRVGFVRDVVSCSSQNRNLLSRGLLGWVGY